jgi:hypothetical protein
MDGVGVWVARDRGRVLLVLAAVLAVAAPWFLVARKLGDVHPPSFPTVHATSLVWAGRVFTSPGQFARWLHSRGASYTAWEHKFPQLTFGTAAQRAAAARSDAKAPAAGSKTTSHHVAAPKAVAKSASAAKTKHAPATHTAASPPAGKPGVSAKTQHPSAPARSASAPTHSAAAAASRPTVSASGGARGAAGAAAEPARTGHALEVVLLLFGCCVVLAGVGAPAVLRLVQPRGWTTVPFEARLMAVATGVSLALAGVIAGGFV